MDYDNDHKEKSLASQNLFNLPFAFKDADNYFDIKKVSVMKAVESQKRIGLTHEENDKPSPLSLMLAAQLLPHGLQQEGPELKESFARILATIKDYQTHDFAQKQIRLTNVYAKGAARLLRATKEGYENNSISSKKPIFIIPSLINSHEIFDLTAKNSFLVKLLRSGRDVYILDWGTPVVDKKMHSLEGLVRERLCDFLIYLYRKYEQKSVDLLGYCMGGLLSLAVSDFLSGCIRKRVFIATPWEFGGTDDRLGQFISSHKEVIKTYCYQNEVVPKFIIQIIFMLQAPDKNIKKYITDLKDKSSEHDPDLFYAIEKWLNSSPDLPSYLMQECVTTWYIDNAPKNGTWEMSGHKICAQMPGHPPGHDLVIYASKDHLVSTESAKALIEDLNQPRSIEVETGHIGLMASHKASHKVQEAVVEFLDA